MLLSILPSFVIPARVRCPFIVLLLGTIALTACLPIQTAAPTAAVTATTSSTIEQLEITEPPVGMIFIPGQRLQRLVLTDDFVYWGGSPNEGLIYRSPLRTAAQPVQIETFAESRYPEGVLLQFPMLYDNNWLTFFDSASPAISDVWALRRINLVTREENILIEGTGNWLLYGFALNDQHAAWSLLDHDNKRTCQDEARLMLADVTTGQKTELDRACFQSEHSWSTLAFHGDTLIANLLQNDVEDAPWGRIARFDLAAGSPMTYTIISDLPDSRPSNLFPQIIGDWLLWNRGQENFGEPVLFNLHTQQPAVVPFADTTAPCQYLQVTGRWIAGHDCADPSRILLYDPAQRQVVRLQTSSSDYGVVIASIGDRVALARAVEPDRAKSDSVIEWYNLEQANEIERSEDK